MLDERVKDVAAIQSCNAGCTKFHSTSHSIPAGDLRHQQNHKEEKQRSMDMLIPNWQCQDAFQHVDWYEDELLIKQERK